MAHYKIGIIGKGIMGNQLNQFFISKGMKTYHCKSTNLDLNMLNNCDLITETAKEDIKIKRGIFNKLDYLKNKRLILTTNTSSLQVSEITKNCKNKGRIFGLHFSNPVSKTSGVEVIKTAYSSTEKYECLIKIISSFGKRPFNVKDEPGFVLNRLLFLIINESLKMVELEGYAKEDIDGIMENCANHPIGPFKLMDLIGLDTTLTILSNLYNLTKEESYKPLKLLKDMVYKGHLGLKNGKGFYTYQKKGG